MGTITVKVYLNDKMDYIVDTKDFLVYDRNKLKEYIFNAIDWLDIHWHDCFINGAWEIDSKEA